MKILTTPLSQFENLPDYPFAPNYLEVEQGLKMHYLDEGPKNGEIVLLLHGEPSWSYLYRHMIPVYVKNGYRAIVPDLIGFGKSDKPSEQSDYTYQRHVDWIKRLIFQLDLTGINLFCQDWGGLIGLRIAAEENERFSRIVAGNTFLPRENMLVSNKAFMQWRSYSRHAPRFSVGKILQNSTVRTLSEAEVNAYRAPFPDDSYKAGARIFPTLVPIHKADVAIPACNAAWAIFEKWEKPFLTLFSDKDPITRGGDIPFKKLIPGAKGQPHQIIKDGGHFLQDDKGEEIATIMVEWMRH